MGNNKQMKQFVQKKTGVLCKCCNIVKPYVTDGECKECYNKNRGIVKVHTKCSDCGEKVRNLYDGRCFQCEQKTLPTFEDVETQRMKQEGSHRCYQCNDTITQKSICYICKRKNQISQHLNKSSL
jgi:hypothetical protein